MKPNGATKRCVTLTDADVSLAKVIGNGNISHGLRLALAVCQEINRADFERVLQEVLCQKPS